jgi:NAD(P)-dependent dehydrogenase (short-subunit alcohol dehydrogenase family)
VAKELGRYKIRCNAIVPGFIETPMTQAAKVKSKVVNQLLGLISLGRVGLPEGKKNVNLVIF